MTNDVSSSPPGLDAFAVLQAEREPWLPSAFFPPADYELARAGGSALIYGGSGGGKSAIIQMLKHDLADRPDTLLVEWLPLLTVEAQPLSETWEESLFQELSKALLSHIATSPSLAANMSSWSQQLLEAFIDAYHPPLWALERLRLREEASDAGRVWLKRFDGDGASDFLFEGMPPTRILRYLLEALTDISLSNVVVLTDGLERWETEDEELFRDQWKEFLALLALFELPALKFKIATPAHWRSQIKSSGAVRRRRLEEFILRWSQADLAALASRRLALASGAEEFSFSWLCPEADLERWLARYGGQSPRGWLTLVRGIYQAYMRNESQPLSVAQWRTLRRQLIPSLRFVGEQAFVGERQITDLSPAQLAVLRYLYVNDRRICTREELYYMAYRGLSRVPSAQEPEWEQPTAWRGAFDMVVSRLREAVEPDQEHPIFIMTKRGQGIQLHHTT